jgi:hypothetical protein
LFASPSRIIHIHTLGGVQWVVVGRIHRSAVDDEKYGLEVSDDENGDDWRRSIDRLLELLERPDRNSLRRYLRRSRVRMMEDLGPRIRKTVILDLGAKSYDLQCNLVGAWMQGRRMESMMQ